jgi:hypothetical protein
MLALLAIVAFAMTALAPRAQGATDPNGDTGSTPTEPAEGPGGGDGGGGHDWSDPDEIGIYSRPVPADPVTRGTLGDGEKSRLPDSRAQGGLDANVYLAFYRLFVGLVR